MYQKYKTKYLLLRNQMYGGQSALVNAIKSNSLNDVIDLLKAGANPNVKINPGMSSYTPLTLAAYLGNPEIVMALLDHGADVYSRGMSLGKRPSAYGTAALSTALHDASSMGHTEVVRSLLEAGADPSTKDSMQTTPFSLAKMYYPENEELIQLLTPKRPFNTVCPICLDEFKSGDKLRLFRCHHAEHMKCGLEHQSNVCPICRTVSKTWYSGIYIYP